MQHSNWSKTSPTLVFVYNANSGIFNAASDYLHKKLSPKTYKCNLCKLTYGMTMDKQWKSFITSLPYKVKFLHSDEFLKQYPLPDPEFPAVFIIRQYDLEPLINSSEINQAQTLEQLIFLIKTKLD